MPDAELYIGLMSGTSADSIDAALVDFSNGQCSLIASHSSDISDLRHEIHALAQPGDNEIQRLGQLDRELGLRFAETVNQLLLAQGVAAATVKAVGSHGQTIRHHPLGKQDCHAFTLQVGDPNTIAQHTGITTVADFRRRDIALGGQGAPLVPAFHQAVFQTAGHRNRAIVNIGGIANITLLRSDPCHPLVGYDTGPGNGLLDSWTQRHLGQPFDRDGSWSRQGKLIEPLLARLMDTPFLTQPAPKSTGRELFNIDWLDNQLRAFDETPSPENVQATLLEFTARTISQAVCSHGHAVEEIYLCGGGARNQALLERISELLSPATVATTDKLGIPADWVEAVAFAWLARQTLMGKPGNSPAVTGARNAAILGAIYPA
ncbi:MAG: anhydro-N-acetylmuramic acid kinase [Porticoccaceae bacterium]